MMTLGTATEIRCQQPRRFRKEKLVSRAQAALKQLGFAPAEVGVAVSETGDQASKESGPSRYRIISR